MKARIIQILTLMLMLPIMPIMGALKVKSIDASTIKWAERARGASAEYAVEAEAAATVWETNTKKAADTYGMAISAAGIKTRFERGVARAGAAKYARKITSVGAGRFATGVDAATTDYKSGAEPYYAVLSALNLPSRKPRGDPANIARVEMGNKALHAKRLALLGAGGG